MQSHKEAILPSAETTLLAIGGAHQGILGPALCKQHWSWQRWTLQKVVHTKMSDIAKYHKMWKQQEKLLKPSQISSIHSMCTTRTICSASHLVPPQPRTLRKICYQPVKWGKRPSPHSSRCIWLTVKSINAPLKRQMLKMFANLAKSAKVTRPRKNKQMTAQQNVFWSAHSPILEA